MTDPEKPMIQINIYSRHLRFVMIAWLSYESGIIEILRSIAEQTPF